MNSKQSATHSLKTWPEYYKSIVSGDKTFEIRRHDRDFRVGDVLQLNEWSPGTGAFSGRSVDAKVTYLMVPRMHEGINAGYVVMGIKLQ